MSNSLKVKSTCVMILLSLVQICIPKLAIASHKIYLATESQGSPKRNFIYDGWYTGAFLPGDSWFYLRWAAQDAEVKGYMDTVIANRHNYDISQGIEWHDWEYQSGWPVNSANLKVHHGNCPPAPSARACVIHDQWSTMVSQNTGVWFQASLYLRTTLSPSISAGTNFFLGAVFHETGHLYGLHERYIESSGSCNSSDFTNMDASKLVNNVLQPCDSNTPTSNDNNRIQTYYITGTYTLDSAVRNGNVINATWKDRAWSDIAIYVDYYKLVSNYYEYKGSDTVFTNVGVHQDVENRNILTSRDVVASWGPGTYQVCVKPWFGTKLNGLDMTGSKTCTPGL